MKSTVWNMAWIALAACGGGKAAPEKPADMGEGGMMDNDFVLTHKFK